MALIPPASIVPGQVILEDDIICLTTKSFSRWVVSSGFRSLSGQRMQLPALVIASIDGGRVKKGRALLLVVTGDGSVREGWAHTCANDDGFET